MAPKKKIKEEVVVADPAVIAGVMPEIEALKTEAALLDVSEPDSKECADEDCEHCVTEEHQGELAMFLSDIPLVDLKELLDLVRESYSRSNNRDFRMRCKRLETSIGTFVHTVDAAINPVSDLAPDNG